MAIFPPEGEVDVNGAEEVNLRTAAGAELLGQQASAASVPVVIASNQSSIPTTISNAATSSTTRVASAVSSHTLIASNPNRKALILYNDGTANQFIKFGTTATTTDFTIKMLSNSTYEMQLHIYSGIIDCISSNTNGAIQVTEIT